MPLLNTLNVLLGKKEDTYNTDPVPTAADNALLVRDLEINWPTEVIDRNVISPNLSPYAPIHGRKYAQMSFAVELKGSGTAGTPADWSAFLECCGFTATVVGATSVTHLPISAAVPSMTIYGYKAGKLFVMTGARGTVRFSFTAGQNALMFFTFTGHAVDDQSAALPSPTLDATIPIVVQGATFTIDSYAAVIAALELDVGNNVVIPDSVNGTDGYGEVTITGRTMQGSIDPEATLVATHDFWSKWEDGAQMAMSIALTGSAGNIATFTAPKIVYRELALSNREEILTYQLPFSAARNAGNDEISLVMT